MDESCRKDWDELDVTKEELKNLSECLKDKEFRKLLTEYAEEVTNPENKKLYEKEITLLEKQRGIDITFVKPEPGYVIKTSVNGNKKCFINVSKNEVVAKPTSRLSSKDGDRGLEWSIPHTLLPPRDDLDKKNVRCVVFDVVFHPNTLDLALKNDRFRKIVNDTAVDGVETNFKVKVDRKNMKFPKLSFKGTSEPSVIRKSCEKSEETKKTEETEMEMEPEIYQKLMSNYDECRKSQGKKYDEKPRKAAPKSRYIDQRPVVLEKTKYAVPKYIVKHQADLELDEFRYSKDAKMHAAIPKRLLIVIDLPLLKSAEDAILDVQEKRIILRSEKPAKYYLNLPLPYTIDADNGSAKFDSKCKKLTATLPVIRSMISLDASKEKNHNDAKSGIDEDKDFPDASSIEILGETEVDGLEDKSEEDNSFVEDDHFMNPNTPHILSPFSYQIFETSLVINMTVKNVIPESIKYRILDRNSGVHVVFKSLGAGFFPICYSMCMKIDEDLLDPSSIAIAPQEEITILKIALKNTTNLVKYRVGLDENLMEHKYFSSENLL